MSVRRNREDECSPDKTETPHVPATASVAPSQTVPEDLPSINIPVKPLGDTNRPRPAGQRQANYLRRVGYIDLEVIDLDVQTRSPQVHDSRPIATCTRANMCSDNYMTRADETRKREDAKAKSQYTARILCREVETGMTMTLSVVTATYLVIQFPKTTAYVDGSKRLQKLRDAMVVQATVDLSGNGFKEKPLPHWRKKPWSTYEVDQQRAKWEDAHRDKPRKVVAEMQMEHLVEYHKSGYGFNPDTDSTDGLVLTEFPFLFVFFRDSKALELAATALYHGFRKPKYGILGWRQAEMEATPSLQFLEAAGIQPSSKIRVDVSALSVTERCHFTTDLEATMNFSPHLFRDRHYRKRGAKTVRKTPTGMVSPIAYLPDQTVTLPHSRTAFFDLECVTTKKGGFPSGKRASDTIIALAVVIMDSRTREEKGYTFTLPGVSRKGTQLETDHGLEFELIECADEKDLLNRYRDSLVVDWDVDRVTGWNTAGFDLPYIGDRYDVLGMTHGEYRGTYLSRELCKHCVFRKKTTTSSAHGTRTSVVPDTPLVTYFDMMVLISKRFKFEQYNLKHVSKQLLDNTKIDMPAEEMFEHWLSGDPERRRMVAAYCYKDVLLPLRIWDKLMLDAQTTALARVCTVMYSEVLNRGELWKAYSLMFIFAHQRGYILTEDPTYQKLPTWKMRQEQEAIQTKYIDGVVRTKKAAEKRLAATRKRLKQSKSAPNYSTRKRTDDEALRNEQVHQLNRLRVKAKLAKKGETRGEAEEREVRYVTWREKQRNTAAWTVAKSEKEEEEEEEEEEESDDDDCGNDEKRYEGAKVLEPKEGVYGRVGTCDFEALYPSIIGEHNICTSTICTEEQYEALKNTWTFKVVDIGSGEKAYIAQDITGFLPLIIRTLLAERKRAKRQRDAAIALAKKYRTEPAADERLAREQDVVADVREGEQLALKIVCNSQYGAIGAPRSSGKYTCLVGARAVTGRGRDLLEQTRSWVEEHFQMLVVVYGDTDSVMVSYDNFRLDLTDPAERDRAIFEHCAQMCKDLTAFFGAPINLEFEKLFYGFFLISKKRYFGMKVVTFGAKPKMDSKGVSSVRRSSVPFLRSLYNKLQNIMLEIHETGPEPAFALLLSELQRIASDKCTIDEFTRTCQLGASYATPQPQSRVRDKMRARAPGSEPRVGDRVPIAMRRPKSTDARAYDMAEDPEYMKKHNLPLATHYFASSLETSIMQLFEIAKLDVDRASLMFEQCQTICNARVTGSIPLTKDWDVIVDYTNDRAENAPPSKRQRKIRVQEKRDAKAEKQELIDAENARSARMMANFFTRVPKQEVEEEEETEVADERKRSGEPPATPAAKKKKKESKRSEFFRTQSKKRKIEQQKRHDRAIEAKRQHIATMSIFRNVKKADLDKAQKELEIMESTV